MCKCPLFVSKGMTSCSRDCFFRVNAGCFSFFGGREGDKASLQCFICRLQIGTVGERSVGMCWLAAEMRVGSLFLESLEVLFGSVTLWAFFLHQTFQQEYFLLMAVPTSASWPNGSSRWWAGRKQLQPTLFTLDTWKRRLWAFSTLPQPCWQWAELPYPWRGALCGCAAALGGAVALQRQLVTFLMILCRKRVLGVLWFFFLLIIWVQLCLMSWKKEVGQ